MGDRANVYVPAPSFADPEKSEGVYLYTHWGGGALPHVVQRALRRRQRWTDGAYLTRIIFSEMVRGVERGETGYGIATYAPDNDRPFCIVVDTEDQRVTFAPASPELPTTATNPDDLHARGWSIEEYCRLSEEAIVAAWNGYDD